MKGQHCTAERPLISVIVPIYNRSMMLRDVIASILHQEYPNLELIVVDDGSDAAEGLKMREEALCATALRIQLVAKPHGGVASARNLGVRSSRGAYIVFLDSDDLLFPDALGAMVDTLEASGAAYCVGKIVDTDFELRDARMSTNPQSAGSILHAAQWSTHASMYRRDVVLSVEPFDETLQVGEDMIFQTKMILRFGQGARCSSFVGVRRLHTYGHLSMSKYHAVHEARYIRAMSTVIATHHAFREESQRVRIFWTASYLQRILALKGLPSGELREPFLRIVNALMHDMPRARAFLSWFVARDRRLSGGGAQHLLSALRWMLRTYAMPMRARQQRRLESAGIRQSLDGLHRTILGYRGDRTAIRLESRGDG